MPRSRSSPARLRRAAALLALGAALLPLAAPAAAPALKDLVETETLALSWARDLDSALQIGLAEYKPVLALFSLPGCGWCARLKAELAAPALRSALAAFVLVEVDASEADVAQRYGIRGAPTVLFFSGDGRNFGGFSGYLPAIELREVLERHANFSADEKADPAAEERFARLAAGTLQPDDWPGLMRQLGDPARRDALRHAIATLDPYPASNLVACLAVPDLAGRLGAIELLEERAGEDRGFDPWLPPADPQAEAARQRWGEWLAATTNPATAEAVFAPLTDARIAAYIQDILGDDRDRTARAMQMLEAGGHHAARQLAAFVQEHPGLAPGLRRRLREVQYAILLHGTAGHQAAATAHQLVFGNLDTRIRTVSSLPATGAGLRAIPILQDLLADENPLLREAACDAILGIAGGVGTVLIGPFLKTESDPNVLFAALRALGRAKSPQAIATLLPFLEHENEDLVIVAIEGLAKLNYSAGAALLAARLQDPRWRVRVAALDAIAELKIADLREAVAAVMRDEDAFVRHAAIRALAAISRPEQFSAAADRLFREFPEQRALILDAMARHNLAIPPAFVEAIAADDDPDRIVACLGAVADMEQRALGLADRLAAHPNPDVSAAARELSFRFGAGSAVHRRHILDALRARSGDELASLLEDLEISASDFQPHALQFRHWLGPAAAPAPTAPSFSSSLLAVINTFEQLATMPAQAPEPALPPRTNGASVEDLIAAFDAVAAPGAPSGAPAFRSASFPDLIRGIEALASNDHPRVAFLASVRLVALGHAGLVPQLMAGLDQRTQEERGQIADALASVSAPAAKPANIALLADPSASVRSRAAGNLIDHFQNEGFATLIDELLRPGTPLRAADLSLRYRASRLSPAIMRRQGHRLLAAEAPVLRAFGVLLAASAWEPDDEDRIAAFAADGDPHLRGAALRTLGFRAPTRFQSLLPAAIQDPSPVVRGAAAQACMNNSFGDSIPLSATEAIGLPLPRAARPAAALGAPEREALRTLSQDPHPPVRFQALLALLSRGETIDASRLAAALDSLPDSSRAVSEVLNVMSAFENGKPRPEWRPLGTALRRHLSDSYWQSRIDKLFGPPMTAEDLLAVNILTRFDAADAPAPIQLDLSASAAAVSNPPPVLLFFHQPGCKECRRVQTLLDGMPRYFDRLEIRVLNVRLREAALLNEALCERFGVPGNARLVAPALFAADGALVGEAITFDSLADLLSRSASREDGRWHSPAPETLAAAEKSIQTRYGETIKTGVIALIALADGINPCAFATIIFLLSYLHIARRDPRQLLQVGVAFIFGVFLAYFAMGLGLVSLLDRLAFLEGLSRAVNLAMAAFVLVIALLSFRDGLLCLRGRMGDMTLQLPGALKERIHAVIRRGARHRRFVAAAFVIGLLIAVIELPCTGQAYLPTIAYMVRDAALRLHALLHLLLYNVLFIAPLVVVFACAAVGLTHERLAALLQRHAATVKFATAALFLALFAVFLLAV